MQLTTSAPCRPNTAYTIGGVSWAAKRRIQRKALHKCRDKRQTNTDKCKEIFCIQDICHDGLGRRLIGNNCCACPPEPYNCLTREVWTDEKKEWCCKHKQLGCHTGARPSLLSA